MKTCGSFDCVVIGVDADGLRIDADSLSSDEDQFLLNRKSMFHSVVAMAAGLRFGDASMMDEVFCEIPSLVNHAPEAVVKYIVPVFYTSLLQWDDMRRFVSAFILDHLLTMPDVDWGCGCSAWSISKVGLSVLQSSVFSATLSESELDECCELWREVVCKCVANHVRIDLNVLIHLEDNVFISESAIHSGTYRDHVLGATLIGILAEKVSTAYRDEVLIPLLESYSSISMPIEVQGAALHSIESLARTMTPHQILETLWPHLTAALERNCSDMRLQAEALNMIVRVSDYIYVSCESEEGSKSILSELLVPVILYEAEFAESVVTNDLKLIEDAENCMSRILRYAVSIGPLLLYSGAPAEVQRKLVGTLQALSRCEDIRVRQNLAYGLPAICLLMDVDDVQAEVLSCVSSLFNDSDSFVLATCASGFSKVLEILSKRKGINAVSVLIPAFITLLRDPDAEVQMRLIDGFADAIKVISDVGGAETVGQVILYCVPTMWAIERAWRTQKVLIEQIESCAHCIPSHTLVAHCLPLLKRLVVNGVSVVKRAAIRATMKCLALLEQHKDFDALIKRYYSGLRDARCTTRILLVYAAKDALEFTSMEMFQTVYLPVILDCTRDRYSSVVLRLIEFLVELYKTVDVVEVKIKVENAVDEVRSVNNDGDIQCWIDQFDEFRKTTRNDRMPRNDRS